MPATKSAFESISIAIVGSGGAGAITAGSIILEAAGKAGWYGIMNRSVGPQIRGGEAAALVRLANQPVDCMAESYDLLVAIDWKNAERFVAEMPLSGDGLVICDPDHGPVPGIVTKTGVKIAEVGLKSLAAEIVGGRENMVALGLAAGFIGLPVDKILAVVQSKLSGKGVEAVTAGRQCVEIGMAQAKVYCRDFNLDVTGDENAGKGGGRWLITGNEAVGLGAVRGGVRFAAAYPITPATEVLEWLAPALSKIGGALVQAEDELSSINMVIGASYGGRASITATSGPGLALMVESIGLAAASEVPLVVVDVMRGGPSTGIPTKSEQSDLNIAIYGCHGDAPHIVVAPLTVVDCLFTGQWAIYLAEAMQVPTIVLSDQSLGQARVLVNKPANVAFLASRKLYTAQEDKIYNRYALTADGVSPMAIPGTPGGQYTADGLTHTINGTPSSKSADHQNQHDKRQGKIANFDYGSHWAEVEGHGDTIILTWGSITGAAREAIRRLADEGIAVKLVAMRLIAPFLKEKFLESLEGSFRILIVEQTHSGQFHRYLRAQCDLPGEIKHFHRPGPHIIGPEEICNQIRDWKTP
ncbi:2-oxoglutarate/2-oxoacid ferredoxin oxidoreductase, gamma subunit / 2-oxoglutarate/2-oxoacid ferredoxin oxidoreductase, alpha subunit [hydrothermal vent metagenome]|uniref:2-oxoglutarate/2-oxoacid ferredoxin oxidoreductase, gamma subunit / 2-oxoglutarate/2-oxoacid ferredoxin oxidoreductase, alpha subunit n=1 Tax=hydrothermal vent metagenome TaxID=652676 RepID=A0A3B0RDZ0_9ZZZZ